MAETPADPQQSGDLRSKEVRVRRALILLAATALGLGSAGAASRRAVRAPAATSSSTVALSPDVAATGDLVTASESIANTTASWRLARITQTLTGPAGVAYSISYPLLVPPGKTLAVSLSYRVPAFLPRGTYTPGLHGGQRARHRDGERVDRVHLAQGQSGGGPARPASERPQHGSREAGRPAVALARELVARVDVRTSTPAASSRLARLVVALEREADPRREREHVAAHRLELLVGHLDELEPRSSSSSTSRTGSSGR